MSSTVGLAGPTREIRLPRNRAVVMLIIDVSPSMESTDVSPTRLEAAKEAGKQFADELTPGINLGSIAFGGSARLPAAGADRIALGRQGKPAHQSRCPKGAFTAARRAKEQRVPISTTSFGTPCGYVDFDDQHLPVPVADDTLKTVTTCPAARSTTPRISISSRMFTPRCRVSSGTKPRAAMPVGAGSGRVSSQ